MRLLQELIALLLLAALPTFSQVSAPVAESYRPPVTTDHLAIVTHEKVDNIILMIGDGMSVATISHARIRGAGMTGSLHMDRMPITGFVRTASADKLITDSAAASSAMACGVKTNNGMIARTPDGQVGQTILEACQRKGMAAGLVVTSSITHATPAGFGAHALSRKEEPLIAEHLLFNRIDVLLGGGRAFFIPQGEEGSRRKDDRNLLELATKQGYEVVQTRSELLKSGDSRLLGLFAGEGLSTHPPEPSLAEMTGSALQILSKNKKGFFLMIEGSQIDWANHDNAQDESARQTLDFDMAVAAVLQFAENNKHTLVIVTADHETGGMAINGGNADGSKVELAWTSKGHNGSTVPLYAYGPGSLRLSGFHENTDIPKAFAALLKIAPFPSIFQEIAPNLVQKN
jgi:alkaline phosphatase